MNCPCQSQKLFADCCEPYLRGNDFPPTPLALMRSRYSAYTLADINYIQRTMQGPALQGFNAERARQGAEQVHWLKLIIVDAPTINKNDTIGHVEFMAFFIENSTRCFIHERSEFRKIDGKWFYIRGKTPSVNRNDPCPCGSTKKFKQCCQDPTKSKAI